MGGLGWDLPPGSAGVLDDLSDVDTTTTPPTDGQAIVFDSASGLWLPGTAGGGGSSFTHSTWTPTVTSSTGTLTTASGSGRYSLLGDHVFFDVKVTITTNGTGGGEIRATLPFNVKSGFDYACVGREIAATGIILQGFMSSGSTYLSIHNSTNGYVGANNRVFAMSGFFRKA